jgi:hypothetical protein
MKTWMLLPVLTLIAGSAYASVVVTETKEVVVNHYNDFLFTCHPGLPSNGHNYPTASSFSFYNLDLVMPDVNVREIGVYDPQMRVGDHCAELQQELTNILPAKLVLTRTVTESVGMIGGECVKSYSEELLGKIGSYELDGTAGFIVGPATGCTGTN